MVTLQPKWRLCAGAIGLNPKHYYPYGLFSYLQGDKINKTWLENGFVLAGHSDELYLIPIHLLSCTLLFNFHFIHTILHTFAVKNQDDYVKGAGHVLPLISSSFPPHQLSGRFPD